MKFSYFIYLLTILTSINLFAQENQNLSNGNVFNGEPYISVNPLNSNHLVVAWIGYNTYSGICIKTKVSFNAGETWSNATIIPHINSSNKSADPSLDFDKNGNVFLSFIDYDNSEGTGAVYVTKSTDGGLSWETPVEVINVNSDTLKPIDRPWIAIDKSNGNYSGNIYITSMPPSIFGYLPPPYHPFLTKSSDNGNSFEQWRYLDTTNYLAGNYIQQPMATLCVANDGTIHTIYPSYVTSQNIYPVFIHAYSSDGGNSFSYNTAFSIYNTISDTLAKKGYIILSDPSNSNHFVFIYLSTPYDDIDVFMRESFDGGISWQNPIKVNDDPTGNNRMQDLVWGDFDNNGNLIVTWRDRRNANDSTYQTQYEIWAAYKTKDSTNFSTNFRLSDTLINYDDVLGNNGNDFMCVKLVNDTINAVWGDNRNGSLNIWYSKISVDRNYVNISKVNDEKIPGITIYPNPCHNTLYVSKNSKTNGKLEIFDTNGKILKSTQLTGKQTIINTSNFKDGSYILKFNNNSIKFIKN